MKTARDPVSKPQVASAEVASNIDALMLRLRRIKRRNPRLLKRIWHEKRKEYFNSLKPVPSAIYSNTAYQINDEQSGLSFPHDNRGRLTTEELNCESTRLSSVTQPQSSKGNSLYTTLQSPSIGKQVRTPKKVRMTAKNISKDALLVVVDDDDSGDNGDGIKASASGADFETYLLDSQGDRVTPFVTVPAAIFSGNSTSPVHAPGCLRCDVEQEARKTFTARQRRARRIGPGVDRSGSILVTEERRARFLDDEDMEEILETK